MTNKSQPQSAPTPSINPRVLTAMVALGTLALVWSLTLWWELVLARRGGVALCGLTEGTMCQSLWDTPFSQAVHRLSGLPVAGWGVVWGFVALALPLLALLRVAEGRPADDLAHAARMTAVFGLLAVAVFIAVGVRAHIFCAGCFLSHVIVAGYAGVALTGWRLDLGRALRGGVIALSLVVVAYLPALYFGLRTPRTTAVSLGSDAGPGASVTAYIATLDAASKQTLSDALAAFRDAETLPLPPPRLLEGSASAPVHITEFSDVMCSHCAFLHETLATLREHFGNKAFSVEPRQFPLDNGCNPDVQMGGHADVRCQAARALICAEPTGHADELAGELFAQQSSLSGATVRQLAEKVLGAKLLDQCLDSDATTQALSQDIQLAMRYDLDGTPLVVINGRKASAFPPFLYLVTLTGGDLSAIDTNQLPPPSAQPHVH